ncbi:beta-carotene ketolase [Persicimonas caeni]|uniref:Beta-carotene ketolase n=1 Tax=Persicimonas caeni TaxID=2292766 RepID=A0A4Y6PSA0_PERCE|nr:fatty acid desaturase [Persicimonas caeni]QDG51224.1 beta-carotene ketolase [Persicimonas caeni]QED32445.1 beta-carotene ketolase [Persicimonas caeni]
MTKRTFKGVAIALTIIGAWAACLAALLTVDVIAISPWLVVPAIAVQTFLYTGLFITAHDAMHGTVAPDNRKLNDLIGTVVVRLYALFSYKKLTEKHWEHHDHPASGQDPDYHNGEHRGFFAWYFNFLKNYVGVFQIIGMAVVFNVLHHLLGVGLLQLNLFWVVPALLSTVQLFYFGTYLPHKEPPEGYADRHRARSNAYSTWVSFLTCYHFGYHWEHHEKPGVPWWRLPQVRKKFEKSV